MAGFRIEFVNGSVHLPALRLWLDPHEPLVNEEVAFVSHAHSDHTAAHREVILSAPTGRLMQARVPGKRLEHILEFGQTGTFGKDDAQYKITLFPAGHIFGSAMSRIEVGSSSLLYTGDFKLRRGLSAEPCEPVASDILIMETTYGRPHYKFPPTEAVLQSVIRFCREALDNDETPVLLGYSLGKSQEILCGLGEAGLPIMLHGTVYRLTQIYEQFGRCFPPYEKYEAGTARGKVLLCPPNVTNSAMLRKLGKTRTAMLTGWAVDPNTRYRYQCDAAFCLSDHADYLDLIEFVKRVNPKKVYTLHGFAAEFAETLRQMGYEAQALSEDEQFSLGLEGVGKKFKPQTSKFSRNFKPQDSITRGPGVGNRGSDENTAAGLFLAFAETCSKIALTRSKLEKVRLVSGYLRTLKGKEVALATTWFSGRPFAASQNKVMQLGWGVLGDVLSMVGGVDDHEFHQIYLKHSDLGETALELWQRRGDGSDQRSLTMDEVAEIFQKLYQARGPLAKKPILMAALGRCSPLEAKFLVKIITGDLRIGLKEGLVEDSIAVAFAAEPSEVRQATLLVGDISETAMLAAEKRLHEAGMVPFRPVKFMLASPEETAADVWSRMGCEVNGAPQSEHNPNGSVCAGAVWVEDKYDGVRCQLHKANGRAALYSRDLKDITRTFQELADASISIEGDFILDGEIVAMRGDEILPFAELQKRLGRREGDLFMREEVPIKFTAFDLLWKDGKTLLNQGLRDRRAELERLSPLPESFRLAHITEAKSAEEVEQAFADARGRKNEGLMIKNPVSAYMPGRRGLAWVKLKKALATLDCVVVGAEYGHGKRSKVLSDYTFAVRDDTTGELKTIGKAYSGLTDVEIEQLTAHFLRTARRQHGRFFEVVPDTVLEIAFDKIQRSERHTSGLAMRFPRIVRIRTDKPISEIDTVSNARKLVEGSLCQN